jgi:hypothetical protein
VRGIWLRRAGSGDGGTRWLPFLAPTAFGAPGSLPGVKIIEGCPDLEPNGPVARGWTGSCKCPMLIRSGCFGAGFDEGEPLVAEVGDDL